MKDLASRFHPIVDECGLELPDDRASDHIMGVAPVLGRIRIAHPDVGDPRSASETKLAVYNKQLAMRAVVELLGPADFVPAKRVIFYDMDARIGHELQIVFIYAACTD